MAKEILKGYSYGMSPKTKEAFCVFAEYQGKFSVQDENFKTSL